MKMPMRTTSKGGRTSSMRFLQNWAVWKYALRHLEGEQAGYVQGQLEAAEAEIESRKEEVDAEKL